MSTIADIGQPAAHPHLAPVTIVVHGDPVGKGRPRFFRGRAVTPAKTRAYEATIRTAGEAFSEQSRFADAQPLCMRVEARMPIPASWSTRKHKQAADGLIRPTGKPDCDNLLKAAADGLNGVLYRDDAQLVETSIVKVYSEHPALIIEIRAV